MRRFSLGRILAAAMMTAAMAMAAHAGDTEGLQQGTAETSRTGPTEVWGFRKYWHSLIYGNVDRTFDKKMDISFAVAPSYTREGSVGIGGAATALYRLDRTDSLMQPSDISLTGNLSIKGFYSLSVKGNNNFKGDRSNLTYKLAFMHKNLNLWGVSYEGCSTNPVSGYTRQQLRLDTDYRYKMLPGFYVGATLNLNYTRALNMGAPEYLEGQRDSYYFTGLGLSLQYDTRDLIVNPSRGIYFMAREVIYPKAMSTHDRTVWSTTIIFDAFVPAWKGSVLAFDLYGQLNSSSAPWTLREEPGPFSLPSRSSSREGYSRTTGQVSVSSSSTG